jgi:hypothetical protein
MERNRHLVLDTDLQKTDYQVPVLPMFLKRWQSMYNLVLTTKRLEGTLNVPQFMLAWDNPGKVATCLNLHVTIKTYHVMNKTLTTENTLIIYINSNDNV